MKAPALLLTLMLVSAGTYAQYQLRVEPVFRNYSVENGLPTTVTYGIRQDSKGYIWVATNSGICRFNGYEFEQLPDTLNCNSVAVFGKSMTEDESGRLWVVDYYPSIYYVENDRIIPWEHNHQLKKLDKNGNFANGILVKGRGEEIWLGASHAGIFHVDQTGQCKFLPGLEKANRVFFENQYGGLSSKAVTTYDVYFQDKMQIESVSFNGDTVQVPLFPFTIDSLNDPNFRLYSDNRLPDGGWVFNHFGTYFYFKNKRLAWRRKASGKATIWTMQDAAGRIFTGHHYGGGLKMYRSLDDFRDNRPADSFLSGQTVTCIIQDREGGYWISTQESGVYYCATFEDGRLIGLPHLENAVVADITWDSKSTVFAGFRRGQVFAIDPFQLVLTNISPPNVDFIQDIAFNEATQTLGLAGSRNTLFQNGRWKTGDFFEPNTSVKVLWAGLRLSPGSNPDVWFSASGSGLTRVNVRTRQIEQSTYNMLNGRGAKRYSCVRQDQTGRVWATSYSGLGEWIGDRIVPADSTYLPFQQGINYFDILPDTSLVLSSAHHGLIFWKPGRTPLKINSQEGLLPGRFISLYYHLLDRSIWATTNRGINKIRLDSHRGYHVETYILKHGLPSNELVASIVVGNDLWVATEKGLYRMNIRPDTAIVPPPVFHTVKVNNVRYFPTGSLTLPHDSSDLSIDLVSLYFRSGSKTIFAYRLLDDSDDTTWTVSAGRRLSFLNLASGQYRLEVKTQSEAHTWSPVSALAIVIRPPWYATWWARGAFAAALVLLAYAGYRYRINQIRTESGLREEMLRLERSALQAQMNPHFIFNCLNSIQHFILKNEPDAAVLYLAKFAKLVRGSLNASVAGEVSLEEEVRMLDNYLALEQLRFKRTFDYKIDVDDRLDRHQTLLPPLIVQPFVENAVLHGMKLRQNNGQITVTFRQEDKHLRIDVQDNGAGMAAMENGGEKASLGSSITQRRLELLQTQNERQAISVRYIVPEGGVGTLVSIRLPL